MPVARKVSTIVMGREVRTFVVRTFFYGAGNAARSERRARRHFPISTELQAPHRGHGPRYHRASQMPDLGALAIAMSGGGARAAYQVGVLRAIARQIPDLEVPILTGVSAGAINAAWYAATTGTFRERTDRLAELWLRLTPDQVF